MFAEPKRIVYDVADPKNGHVMANYRVDPTGAFKQVVAKQNSECYAFWATEPPHNGDQAAEVNPCYDAYLRQGDPIVGKAYAEIFRIADC